MFLIPSVLAACPDRLKLIDFMQKNYIVVYALTQKASLNKGNMGRVM
jgi:hypothetical protein